MVASFEPSVEADRGLTTLLAAALEQALDELPGIEAVRPPEGTTLSGTAWEVWLESCPEGQYIGCANRLGYYAEARWVITGFVEPRGRGHRVRVVYVDVEDDDDFEGETQTLRPDASSWLAFTERVAAELTFYIETGGHRDDIRLPPPRAPRPPRGDLPLWLPAPEIDALRPGPLGIDQRARAWDLVVEVFGGAAFGGTETTYEGDVVLDAASRGTLAAGAAVQVIYGFAGAAGLGAGVALSRNVELLARARITSGRYRQSVRTSVHGGGAVVDREAPSRVAGGGAEVALRWRIRPARVDALAERGPPTSDDGSVEALAAMIGRSQAPSRRVSPFLEAGAVAWTLPTAPDTQAALRAPLPATGAWRWWGGRLAVGAELAASQHLDVSIGLPITVLYGPQILGWSQGDASLLAAPPDPRPARGAIAALELTLRPRVPLGRPPNAHPMR